ncbi:uncharacterized protein AstCC [Planococcus citri]|uniref:uncharacterized protein AstCC n=1 Tax=Planococcus citri TaxID=170843 RepID=UPI0031F78E84
MMTGLVKELCLQFFLLVNLYHALEATWHETVDTNGETKIYHTIPRIKRVQDLQQSAPMSIDKSSLPYDDYPVVVPKRTALALDRIMVALQKALDDGRDSNMKGYYPESGSGLQRRGQEKGKVYWRCYFNAVTCF